jgi:hypothetical protein
MSIVREYKKLDKEMSKQTYKEAYKPLNTSLKYISMVGNLGSIFLGSFFISDLLSKSIGNMWVVWTVSLILLGSIELIKRFIFDRFSLEFLKVKSIFKKSVLPLAFFSLCVIGMSFYSSLNGAKEFSTKNDQITEVTQEDIGEYTDSLTTMYNTDIEEIENEIDFYKNKINEKDEEQKVINESLQERGYLYRSEKARNKQLTEEKESLESKISDNEDEIEVIEEERDTKIEEYEKEKEGTSEKEKDENKNDSIIFVGLSTLIEFLILIGIYHNKHYLFKSYKETRRKISNDPNYQRWYLFSDIMDIIYMDSKEEMETNKRLPTVKNIWDFCKAKDLPMVRNDLSEFLKLMEGLKIIKTKGSAKFLIRDFEEAEKALENHFTEK